MHTPTTTPVTLLLTIATAAAIGLLALTAADRGSILAWAFVPLPLVLAIGAAHFAVKAVRRNEGESAANLLSLGLTANVIVACLAGLLG